MFRVPTLAIFTVLQFLAVSKADQKNCPYADCTCSDTVVDCTNKGWTELPTRVKDGAQFLTLLLTGNSIEAIPEGALPVSMDTIDLRGNPVTDIAPTALRDSSKSLKTIRFQNANWTAFPQALELLDNLETLDLEDTVLKTFSGNVLAQLSKSVLDLRLVNVGLRDWPSWLQNFVFLRRLTLDKNRLSGLGSDSLNIWRNELTHLSLSNAQISNTGFLAVLTKLESLDLSQNRISDADTFSFNVIPLANTLKYIDLSNNQLTGEPRLIEMRVLTEVNLEANKISKSTFGALPQTVTTLNLNENLFTEIPDFIGVLPNIKTFSIRSNAITSIKPHDFAVGTRLEKVSLGNNPIVSIDEHAFDQFRYTTYLDLENTKLDRLPIAFSVLRAIEEIWMPNNNELICTCDEKALATWFSSRPTLRLTGQCGLVDIKEFIGQLALLCPSRHLSQDKQISTIFH